jgi:hypothetical protein
MAPSSMSDNKPGASSKEQQAEAQEEDENKLEE